MPWAVYSPARDRCPVSETPDRPAKSGVPAKPAKAADTEGSASTDAPIKTDKSDTPPATETTSKSAEVPKSSEKASDVKSVKADKPVSSPKDVTTKKADQPSKTAEPEKAAKADTSDKPVSSPKDVTTKKADQPSKTAEPEKAAKADTSDKPAKPAKPAPKPKPEDKPFAAFIQEDLLPSLTKSLSERQHPPVSLELVEGERPVVGGNCWMVEGELSAGRRFWLCFESDAITSGKTIALAESGSDPSLLESFLIDEKRINQALLESRLLQRLNGQKWFGGN